MQNRLSPQKYIITKARSLPFCDCLINQEWDKKGMAAIFVSKRMPSGNFILAYFLVDIYCLGIKNTFYQFNINDSERLQQINKLSSGPEIMINCNTELLHNIIFGAVDYASDLGFVPHKDFGITQHFLNTDLITDGIDEIEFGKNGMPLFVAGPDDNVAKIIAVLNKNVGEGNFHYIYEPDESFF